MIRIMPEIFQINISAFFYYFYNLHIPQKLFKAFVNDKRLPHIKKYNFINLIKNKLFQTLIILFPSLSNLEILKSTLELCYIFLW